MAPGDRGLNCSTWNICKNYENNICCNCKYLRFHDCYGDLWACMVTW